MEHKREEVAAINGTSLQGYVGAHYAELVAVFGKPRDGDGYKVDAQWVIRFEDNTIATIYNYKDGINYCGDGGTPVEKITDWHVGGRSPEAVSRVHEAIAQFRAAGM